MISNVERPYNINTSMGKIVILPRSMTFTILCVSEYIHRTATKLKPSVSNVNS